jgi:protein-disulfide isomerase
MKRLALVSLALLACSATAFAAEVDPKLDRAVRDALPVCADTTVAYEAYPGKLPARFKGTVVRLESKRPACGGQLVAVTSPSGGFYLGAPWPIGDEEGANPIDKLRNFTWRNMQLNVTPVIETKLTDDGLYPVTLLQATETGKIPLDGAMDPEGKFFFLGKWRRPGADIAQQRTRQLETLMAKAPVRGGASAPVTVVEFSDFECPSCKRSSGYADTILAKHGDKVRYVRFDLPLTGHPWSFPASLAGRAIYRQNPELFWEYKKQVYANQENLNAFTFWDWARGFAQDNELDLTKYDADLANEEIKTDILKGAGLALSNDVRATPTYMVNGTIVDAGDEGKALFAYIDGLVK